MVKKQTKSSQIAEQRFVASGEGLIVKRVSKKGKKQSDTDKHPLNKR